MYKIQIHNHDDLEAKINTSIGFGSAISPPSVEEYLLLLNSKPTQKEHLLFKPNPNIPVTKHFYV